MLTVFLFIPNYVYSSDLLRTRFIGELAERFRVIVFLPMPAGSYFQHPNITYVHWRLQFPGFWTFWGKTIRVPLIRMFDHEPLIRRNYELSFGHWKRRLLRRLAFLFPPHFWNPDFISRLEQHFLPRSPAFERAVATERPALVITPTPGFTEMDAEAIVLARRAGLPSAAIDFSWDNLTSNCKHLRKTDHLVCWTQRMREQAIGLHGFRPERSYVSGIMRFDHYFRRDHNANLQIDANVANAGRAAVRERSHEEFLISKGLDPRRKTILITTVTRGNYRDEPAIVRALIRARQERKFPGVPNIFIRLHPKEDSYRDFQEFTRVPGVHVERSGTEMTLDLGSRIEMDESDLVNLKDTLRHSDVVLNYASTITLEACAFDKPVVNIGFPPYFMNAYSFTHYRPVVELGAVRIVKSLEELVAEINAYLQNPGRDRENRKAAVREFIGYTDAKSYQRVADHLERIIMQINK